MMKYDAGFLSDLINASGGIEKALEFIDVEQIDDHTIKIICRTIQHSCSELQTILEASQSKSSVA